jgi:hypothetical protein
MTIERDCDLAQREFFLDWDWRVGKLAGVPRHFLGSGHPIPVFAPLPKKPKGEGN